ncbi:MAG: CDP-diacylglycerol--serine O-phosphatidyltransferase [Candidatus Omnitrophica bacterium]|nr:CDP-diacylglycerol--serine O-phosphatidyltransferase [Candidatus Omnitrophota bacterium]
MNHLANIISIISLLCGFTSIIFSLEGHFTFASWAIIFSVIFDGIDGQVARMINSPSNFGKELDSLVDVISFGIAPTVLGYIFVYRDFHLFATVALFIYLLCSVMRLAKYNITVKDEIKNYFYGLPTTVSGGILASFILIYRRYTHLPAPAAFFILVIVLAALMVSKIKYANLDALKDLFRNSALMAAGVILAGVISVAAFYVATGVFLSEIFIFTLFVIYLLFSPFMLKSFSSVTK